MDIIQMHHAIDDKLNKLNVQRYDAILPDQKDAFINEAMMEYIQNALNDMRNATREGFQDTQDRLDDLRTLHVNDINMPIGSRYIYENFTEFDLPSDYMHLVDVSSQLAYDCRGVKAISEVVTENKVIGKIYIPDHYDIMYDENDPEPRYSKDGVSIVKRKVWGDEYIGHIPIQLVQDSKINITDIKVRAKVYATWNKPVQYVNLADTVSATVDIGDNIKKDFTSGDGFNKSYFDKNDFDLIELMELSNDERDIESINMKLGYPSAREAPIFNNQNRYLLIKMSLVSYQNLEQGTQDSPPTLDRSFNYVSDIINNAQKRLKSEIINDNSFIDEGNLGRHLDSLRNMPNKGQYQVQEVFRAYTSSPRALVQVRGTYIDKTKVTFYQDFAYDKLEFNLRNAKLSNFAFSSLVASESSNLPPESSNFPPESRELTEFEESVIGVDFGGVVGVTGVNNYQNTELTYVHPAITKHPLAGDIWRFRDSLKDKIGEDTWIDADTGLTQTSVIKPFLFVSDTYRKPNSFYERKPLPGDLNIDNSVPKVLSIFDSSMEQQFDKKQSVDPLLVTFDDLMKQIVDNNPGFYWEQYEGRIFDRTLIIELDKDTGEDIFITDATKSKRVYEQLNDLQKEVQNVEGKTVLSDVRIVESNKIPQYQASKYKKSTLKSPIGEIYGDKIRVYSGKTFIPTLIYPEYIRKPKPVKHPDSDGGGRQDCELPIQTHREIINIAVNNITAALQPQKYQVTASEQKLNP